MSQICVIEQCKAWCYTGFWVVLPAERFEDKDLMLYFKHHGVVIDQDNSRIFVPCKCRKLSPKGKCLVYKYRPEICKKFWCKKELDYETEKN